MSLKGRTRCRRTDSQRLKLSGMRWNAAGAQVILDLRVVLLSGIWQETYERVWVSFGNVEVPTPHQMREIAPQLAA